MSEITDDARLRDILQEVFDSRESPTDSSAPLQTDLRFKGGRYDALFRDGDLVWFYNTSAYGRKTRSPFDCTIEGDNVRARIRPGPKADSPLLVEVTVERARTVIEPRGVDANNLRGRRI